MPVFGSRDTPRPIRGQYSGQVENVVTRFWLSFHVTMLGHNIGGGVSVGAEVELELDSGQEGGMIAENPLVGNDRIGKFLFRSIQACSMFSQREIK